MKKIILLLSLVSIVASFAVAQLNAFPESYIIEPVDIEWAKQIVAAPPREKVVMPNPHPDAQWFPSASLGLFMHWGIHSVVGAQPSWDMISNYRWGGKYSPPDKYYKLAKRFDPQYYEPDKWLKAAKDAGFNYAVLTTKHHDGYALWPSKYGISTKQYLGGRDLLKPYVEACRANGLKVGFYFSPQDWHYPGFMHPKEFNVKTRDKVPPIVDQLANQQDFECFFAFVMKQLEEILTRYGKIDVLWFDGMYFHGISNMHTEKVYAWIRSLQPGIVINDRWAGVVNPDDPDGNGARIGDFATRFECVKPTYVPAAWWDHCDIWTESSWGYAKNGKFKSPSWFLEHLVTSRSLGGNFLANASPGPDGDMHPNYYKNMAILAEWMKHSGKSVIGAGPSPGMERSNVMITTHGNIWYLHLLPEFNKEVSLKTDQRPQSVSYLRTGEPVTFKFWNGFIKFKVPSEARTDLDDVITVVQ